MNIQNGIFVSNWEKDMSEDVIVEKVRPVILGNKIDAPIEKVEKIETQAPENTEKEITDEAFKKELEGKIETPVTPETTPKVEDEGKSAEEETEKVNSLFEKIVNKTTTEGGGDEPLKPEVVVDEKIQEQLKALESEIAKYKENPLVKALELGKDLKEVAKQLIGEDYSQKSYEQLLEMKIAKEFKLEGEELQEAVQEELAQFEGMSKLGRAKAERELRNEFASDTNVNASKILTELNEYQSKIQSQTLTPEQIAKVQEDVKTNDLKLIDDIGSQLDGADIEGVKITKEYIDKVKANHYNFDSIAPYVNPKDNTFDAQQFIVDKFILDNHQELLKAAYERGKKEAIKSVANPDRNTRGGTPVAPVANKKEATLQHFGGKIKDMKVVDLD